MLRLAFRAVSLVSLLAAGFLVWLSDAGKLPSDAAAWVTAYFGLFQDPVVAAALLLGCVLFSVASACVTELLVGLIFTIASAGISVFCLLGILGSHYPPLAKHLVEFFK